MSKINNKRKLILKAKAVKGFNQFITKVKVYPINTKFTIEYVIPDIWANLGTSERISLGRTVKTNVQEGTITGLECIPVSRGKQQEYQRIADVIVDEPFKCDYFKSQKFNSKKDLLECSLIDKDTAIAIGYFEQNEQGEVTTYYCKVIDAQGNILVEPCKRDLRDEFFEQYRNEGIVKYGEAYAEFRALFSFWYLVDRCYENQNLLNGKNEILFVAPNEQMVTRLAGIRFDSQANSYFYNDMINDLFEAFKKDGYRELKIDYKSTSQHNSDIKKIF